MDLKQNYVKVMNLIGYQFKNKELLFQAFKRNSYTLEHGGENNEILEFIGDTILEYCIVKLLTENFMGVDKELYTKANLTEFDFTEYKQDICNNDFLSKIIDKLNLAQYLYLGTPDIKNKAAKATKVKADLFEAIIGAITIDCNYNMEKIYKVVVNLLDCATVLKVKERLECYVNVKADLDNAITEVKELADKHVFILLKYTFGTKQKVIDGWKMWPCKCVVNFRKNGKIIEISKDGYGTTKVEAKKDASLDVLKEYKSIIARK